MGLPDEPTKHLVYLRVIKFPMLGTLFLSAATVAAATVAAPPLPVAVVAMLSECRTNPHGFADRLRAYRALIGRDNIVRTPGEAVGIQLTEGVRAVDEAIAVLDALPPLEPLTVDPLLTAAASDFAAEQGRSGEVGHVGHDGSTLAERIERRGQWTSDIAEAISYGYRDALHVAIQLIVDDDVPDRGHREVILTPALRFAGAGCSPHREWHHSCVVDFSATPLRPVAAAAAPSPGT